MSAKVTIIRHAPTEYNRKGIFMGRKDVPIEQIDTGKVENIRNLLKRENSFSLYSSPLQRAYETAKKISDNNYDIVVDERLTERGLGDWEGLSKKEIENRHREAFHDNVMDFYYTPQNGEHYESMIERISSFLIDKCKPDMNVVIVTHNGVFRVIKSLLTGDALSNVFSQAEPFLTPQTFILSEELMQTIKQNSFYTVDRL